MKEVQRAFSAGILDFNTRRMTSEEALEQGIPRDLQPFVGDWRQYPLKIAEFLPEGTLWFSQDQPWYFREVLGDEERVTTIRDASLLILSGSGMSAYKFQEGMPPADPPQEGDRELLEKAETLVKNFLGEGKWVFGDCFGGQFSIHAVGGRLGSLPRNHYGNTITEAGYLKHQLTEEGKKDEVFGDLPSSFYGAHFHNDFIETLPEVGSTIDTESGDISVVRSEVLVTRNGYLDRGGLVNAGKKYIHGAVVEFDNGARLYHTQFHPEMSTPDRANFFTRRVEWWLSQEEQMGPEYASKAKEIPVDADYDAAEIIRRFVQAYKDYLSQEIVEATMPAIVQELRKYLIN